MRDTNRRIESSVSRSLWAALCVVGLALLTVSCSRDVSAGSTDDAVASDDAAMAPENAARATFAGGCFWCMEPPYDVLEGVYSTTSGYAGGPEKDPTYAEVSRGATGHAEVVQVVYDPDVISYEKLLEVFWRNIDPTVENRQFCDRGPQYRTAIYAHDAEQLRLAEASRDAILAAGTVDRIVTEIEILETFYPAEDYHQDFYVKSPARYKSYRLGCGRDRRLAEIWGDAATH